MPRSGSPNESKVLDSTYSAEVVIRRVRTVERANERGYFDEPPVKNADELTTLKLTSTTLEGIVLKIKQHVDLVEDE